MSSAHPRLGDDSSFTEIYDIKIDNDKKIILTFLSQFYRILNVMNLKKSDSPVTQAIFLKETKLMRKEFFNETQAIRTELKKEFFNETQAIRAELKSETQAIRAELKEESNKLDQKINILDQKFNGLVLEVIKNREEIKEIKETMATKSDSNKILCILDAIKLYIETSDRKMIVHDHRLNEIEPTLEDHGQRICKLETVSS